jgi:uncharacterized protein
MINKILKVFFISLVTLNVASVFAADLQQAKSEGLVGEQLNGYLGVVSSETTAEVRALITDVNAKRKDQYESIAAKNGTSVETIELLAGKKAVEKTEAGNYVQTVTGWSKK